MDAKGLLLAVAMDRCSHLATSPLFQYPSFIWFALSKRSGEDVGNTKEARSTGQRPLLGTFLGKELNGAATWKTIVSLFSILAIALSRPWYVLEFSADGEE